MSGAWTSASRTCARCGLRNIPERRTCKRCGQDLDAPGASGAGRAAPTIARKDEMGWARLAMRSSFIIETPLPLDEARVRLARLCATTIDHRSGEAWLREQRSYTAALNGDRLVIDGPHSHKKQALITSGELQSTSSGSRLRLEMRPHPTAWIIAGMLGAGVIAVCALTEQPLAALVPVAMCAMLYAVILANVRAEAATIAEILADALAPMPPLHSFGAGR